MNEQLQQALATILGKTMEGIDASVAFMQAELPDVIQQLLLWYGVKSAIMCTLGFIIPFVFYKLSMKLAKATFLKAEDEEWMEYPM